MEKKYWNRWYNVYNWWNVQVKFDKLFTVPRTHWVDRMGVLQQYKHYYLFNICHMHHVVNKFIGCMNALVIMQYSVRPTCFIIFSIDNARSILVIYCSFNQGPNHFLHSFFVDILLFYILNHQDHLLHLLILYAAIDKFILESTKPSLCKRYHSFG